MSTASLPVSLDVSKVDEVKTLYKLTYKSKQNPHPLFKYFYSTEKVINGRCTPDLIQRCRDHCKLINMVFLQVDPFFSSLEEDERRYQIGN